MNRKRKRGEGSLPRGSASMSLRLAIPWCVALQQSSPPLHQSPLIVKQNRHLEKRNVYRSNTLSHVRGHVENVYGNTLISIENLSEVKKLSTCVNNELSQIIGPPPNAILNNANIGSR